MTHDSNANNGLVDAEAMPEFLAAVRDLVAMANSGGGVVSVVDLRLGQGQRLSDLKPSDLQGLVQPFVGPSSITIRRVMRLPGPGNEIAVTIGRVEQLPLVLTGDSLPRSDGPGYYAAGDILVRRAGRAERADYSDMVKLLEATARSANNPETATTLLDVSLARRARNSSSLLDRMDLLWCLIERDSIDLKPPRLSLLLRSSLRRTPTLFFWLAEVTDRTLVEEVLTSSLNDEDRDSSDAMDSILEVGAMFASEICLEQIIYKMRVSQYSHFRDAASEWPGRRATLDAFEQGVSSFKLDGSPATGWPLPALYKLAKEYNGKLSGWRCPAMKCPVATGKRGRFRRA